MAVFLGVSIELEGNRDGGSRCLEFGSLVSAVWAPRRCRAENIAEF